MRKLIEIIIPEVERIGSLPEDSEEQKVRKSILILISFLMTAGGLVWAAISYRLGLAAVSLIPLIYSAIIALNIGILILTKRYVLFRFTLLFLSLILPFAFQWLLGGYRNSGALILWSLIAPFGSMMFSGLRPSMIWGIFFLLLIALSGLADHYAPGPTRKLPMSVVTVFYIFNIGSISLVVYLVAAYFLSKLRSEHDRAERLLLNILPASVAERLKRGQSSIADRYDQVSVMFIDIENFTPVAGKVSPARILNLLNDIFSRFDELTVKFGLEKIKTIGDSYLAVAGLPEGRPDHAEACVRAALEMQRVISRIRIVKPEGQSFAPFRVRVGIHCGPVVAGVIGRNKFAYDIWGDTVNTASRMESHGVPGRIQVSQSVYNRVKDLFNFEERGHMDIKGKGRMKTYLLIED